jgi:hypothetical protein
MREISLHLIDVIQNSIEAGSTLISIFIEEDTNLNLLRIQVKDNGCGISEDDLSKVVDPFYTSRKSRKVGLGISLFEAACKRCDGSLSINSVKGKGTEVIATFKHNHIDRAPIGRIEDTIVTSLLNKNIDIFYCHKKDGREFIFDSRDIKKIVEGEICNPDVLKWIREYIRENIEEIGGGN